MSSDPGFVEIQNQHGPYRVRADIFNAAFTDYLNTTLEDGPLEDLPPMEIAVMFFLFGCQCGDTLKWDTIVPGSADTLIKLVKKGEKEPDAG